MARGDGDERDDTTGRIADQAMSLPIADRRAFLERACGGNGALQEAIAAEIERRQRKATELTQLLRQAETGRPEILDRLARLLGPELHDMARRFLRGEPNDPEVQTTILADDAFFKVFGAEAHLWQSRRHFWGAVSNAMTQLCKDYAKRRNAKKRDHRRARPLDHDFPLPRRDPGEAAQIAELLDNLEIRYRRPAEVVRLCYFAERNLRDVAQMLDVSYRTVKNDWQFARAWLHRELEGARSGGAGNS